MMDASGAQPRPMAHDAVPSGLGKSITGDTQQATVRLWRQKRHTLQRAKKVGGKKEQRNQQVTTQVKMLEEGHYQLFNILKEIQEWWEVQAIMAVIGQELEAVHFKKSGDSEGADTATGKPTEQQSINIQYNTDSRGKVRSRSATTVEHAGGGD